MIAESALLLFQNVDWAGAALGIDIPVLRGSWLTFRFTLRQPHYLPSPPPVRSYLPPPNAEQTGAAGNGPLT